MCCLLLQCPRQPPACSHAVQYVSSLSGECRVFRSHDSDTELPSALITLARLSSQNISWHCQQRSVNVGQRRRARAAADVALLDVSLSRCVFQPLFLLSGAQNVTFCENVLKSSLLSETRYLRPPASPYGNNELTFQATFTGSYQVSHTHCQL